MSVKKKFINKNKKGGVTLKRNRNEDELLLPSRKTKNQDFSKLSLQELLKIPNDNNNLRLETIMKLINEGNYDSNWIYNDTDIDNIEFKGNNLIQQAIINNYRDAAIQLIQNESKKCLTNPDSNYFNNQNEEGYTAIMLSIKYDELDVFNALIDAHKMNKCSINVSSKYIEKKTGCNTLLLAILSKSDDNNDKSYCINYLEPLFEIFGTEQLSIEYETSNGLTALIAIMMKVYENGMDDEIDIMDEDKDEKIILEKNKVYPYLKKILETDNYNPNAVWKKKLKIDTYTDRNFNAFLFSILFGFERVMIHLLKNIEKPNLYFDMYHVTENNYNAFSIQCIAYRLSVNTLELLLDLDFNIGLVNNNYPRVTPLLTLCSIPFEFNNYTSEEIIGFENLIEKMILKGEECNLNYISPDIANRKTALLAYLINIFTVTRESNNKEKIPMLILNSGLITRENLLVKTNQNLTALDIALFKGLHNVANKIEELLEETLPIQEKINIFETGITLLGENITVYNHISKNSNNIAMKLNDNIFLLKKHDIRKNCDKAENIVFSCNERDVFSIDNINTDNTYCLLNKFTQIPAIIDYTELLELLNDNNTGQLYILEIVDTINSYINKDWFLYQNGNESIDWNPAFDLQQFCRAGPISIVKIKLALPYISEDIVNMIEKNNISTSDESMKSENQNKIELGNDKQEVKARITFKTLENKLVEKGIKNYITTLNETTIKDLKKMIINDIVNTNNDTNNNESYTPEQLEIRRLIFSGRDYTDEEDKLISEIIKNNDINTFQPVIISIKSIGGKKLRIKTKKPSKTRKNV